MDRKEEIARALQGQQPPTIMDRLGLSEYLPDWLYDRSTLDRAFPVGDPNQSVFTNAMNLAGRAPWELPYLAADVINSGEALMSRPVVSQDPEAPAHAMVMAGAAPVGAVAARAANRTPGTIFDHMQARRLANVGDETAIRKGMPTAFEYADILESGSAPGAIVRSQYDDPPAMRPANNQVGFNPRVVNANPDDGTTGTVMDMIARQLQGREISPNKSPAPPLPRELDGLGFYSQALEATKALSQNKGTPQQMLAQLKKAGVKDAEIEATGLREFMDGKQSVTRAELVQHLRGNRTEVRETKYTPESGAQWSKFSLDSSNPTYRETVVHLPQSPRGDDVHSGHFDEPNVIGHIRSTVHDGPDGKTFLAGELQSDWGQRIRKDGGAQDEAKVSRLLKEADAAAKVTGKLNQEYQAAMEARPSRMYGDVPDRLSTEMFGKPWKDITAEQRQAVAKKSSENHKLNEEIYNKYMEASRRYRLLESELSTAQSYVKGHPIVNTTDQWVSTMLRKGVKQAVDDGADWIALPSGATVDGYGMDAPRKGLEYAYDQMYPKKLRDVLKKIDPKAATPENVPTLRGASGNDVGEGFVRFPITETIREQVRKGQPLFANPSTATILDMIARQLSAEDSAAYRRGDLT